jgi:hypothetical protein
MPEPKKQLFETEVKTVLYVAATDKEEAADIVIRAILNDAVDLSRDRNVGPMKPVTYVDSIWADRAPLGDTRTCSEIFDLKVKKRRRR